MHNKLHSNKIALPKISIITPTYNQANYIEETIKSVLNQEYPNLEYIIIDGGSTDGTVGIIKKYESKLAYWVSERDKGMYDALQKGFNKSTGEIMAWINSDDKYYNGSFSLVAEIFTKFKEVNWVMGNSTSLDEFGRTVFVDNIKSWTKYDFYTFNYKFLQQESIFWRRTLWEKAGNKIDTNLKYAGDFELWLRFFRYDQLFIVQTLIGGFRFRKQNQISLNYLKEYVSEAEAKIREENIHIEDKRIVNNYYKTIRITKALSVLKVFNANWLVRRFKRKYFKSQFIIFNSKTHEFEIHEY